MIKRTGAIALTMLYLATAVGFALNVHYCFNQITAVNIDVPVKSCGMLLTDKMKCCKDKHFLVKVNDAHQGKVAPVLSANSWFKVPAMRFTGLFVYRQQELALQNFRADHPDPPLSNITPYLKNCVFRI